MEQTTSWVASWDNTLLWQRSKSVSPDFLGIQHRKRLQGELGPATHWHHLQRNILDGTCSPSMSFNSNFLKISCKIPEGLENLLYTWTEDPLSMRFPWSQSQGLQELTPASSTVTHSTHVALVFQVSVYSIVGLGAPLHSTSKHHP